MSIKLRGTRNRRNYADYKPASRRNQGSRSDPFRVILELILIAGGVWAILNKDLVTSYIGKQVGSVNINSPVAALGPTPTASPPPDQFAQQALDAYKAGNLDKAIELYGKAGDSAPNSVEYHFQLARILLFKSALQTGAARDATLKKATDAANAAILANPEKPDGYAILGKILDWQGQPDQAMTQLSRALEGDNKNYALGNSYMAEVLVDLQRWDQAQTAIQTALSIDPKNPDILRDNGYVLESQQDYTDAAAQYEASLAVEQNQPYVKMSLARAYRQIGKYNEALDQLFAVDTLQPKNALVEFELGVTYEAYVGDPTSAIKYYEQATQSDPNYASPYIRLGTIHYAQGSFQQAIPNFEQAIKLGVTDRASLYIQLALAYANQNRCDQAVINLQKAEKLVKPDDSDSLDKITQGYKQCPAITPSPTTRPR